jgi:hypothetical protein
MEKFRSLVILISILLCSSNSIAQDFVLRCSKFYTGSQSTDVYSILINKDRTAGFFVYNDREVFRLNLTSKSESDYDFKSSPFVSSNGSFLKYKSISINRQTLDLYTTSYDWDIGRTAKCEKSDFNVMNLVENIKIQNLAYVKKEASEESARKATLNKDAKF